MLVWMQLRGRGWRERRDMGGEGDMGEVENMGGEGDMRR